MLKKWTAVEAHLCNENAPEASIKAYKSAVTANCNLSINERRKLASQYTSTPVFWSWDIPRTREGYYHFRNGAATAIKRSIEFAPYADLLWVETGDPSVETATKIARQIREAHPGKKLVYNLSPSFNWLGQGFSEEKLKSFVWDIAREGYDFFIHLPQIFLVLTISTASFFNSSPWLDCTALQQSHLSSHAALLPRACLHMST